MKIYVGTSGYGHKEWKGRFYPEKIADGDMLRFYAERLFSVEINNTFYHMPTDKVLASWAEQVPDNFVFAIKAPQLITHIKRLRNVGDDTEYLFSTLSVLQKKLGPVLFQFPKSFHADHPALKDFLGLIAGSISCAFEFRHPSWINDEILSLLNKGKHSLCIADTDEDPVNEIVSTAPWGYLRLRRSGYTDADLSQWMDMITAEKWKRVYVYFKHEEGPETAIHFRKLEGSVIKKSRGR